MPHKKLVTTRCRKAGRSLLQFFSQLITLFPEAHFIQMVRDPRATVASLLQVGAQAAQKQVSAPPWTTSLRGAVHQVDQYLAAGFLATEQAPTKILTVGYETLVTEPTAQTQRICDYLSIDWSAQMLTPTEVKHDAETAITTHSHNIWYNRQSYNRNPSSHSLNLWTTRLSAFHCSWLFPSIGKRN